MSNENQVFARKLRDSLKRRGLTHKEASTRFGVSVASVENWTSGRAEPGATTLGRISKELGVTCDSLLGLRPDHIREFSDLHAGFNEQLLHWACQRAIAYLKDEGLYQNASVNNFATFITETYKIAAQRDAENKLADTEDSNVDNLPMKTEI